MYDTYLELFINYLESNNRSKNTIEQYEKEISKFFNFLVGKKIEDIEEVRAIHIDLYMADQIKKKNASSTRAKKLTIIKSLFKFLFSREYITKNPTLVIDGIKIKDVDRKKKFVLTRKESERLIKTVTKYSRNVEKSRLMLFIMLKCALRVDELCNLKVDNIDTKGKVIRVNGKGGKTRYVPLFDEMNGDLKAYLKKRSSKSEFLFTNKNTDEAISTRAVHDFVKSYVEKAGIRKNIGCHALRRTAATQLLKDGASITSIQKFLGHSSVSTTEKYLLESESEILKEIREKTKDIITKK